MAWIESHAELGQHPKMRKLARTLGVSVPCAVGHLQFLWWWTLSYAPDGNLSEFEAADIADGCMWEGDADLFMAALQDARFLDGFVVHDWDEYGGKLHRRRMSEAERKRSSRAAQTLPPVPPDVPRTSGGHPGDGAETAYVEDRTGQDRTGQDRTAEDRTAEDGAAAGIPPERNQEFTERYESLLMRFSRKSQEDRGLCEEIAEFAERFTQDELAKALAIHRIRNPGKPPWPSMLRAAMREVYESHDQEEANGATPKPSVPRAIRGSGYGSGFAAGT